MAATDVYHMGMKGTSAAQIRECMHYTKGHLRSQTVIKIVDGCYNYSAWLSLLAHRQSCAPAIGYCFKSFRTDLAIVFRDVRDWLSVREAPNMPAGAACPIRQGERLLKNQTAS